MIIPNTAQKRSFPKICEAFDDFCKCRQRRGFAVTEDGPGMSHCDIQHRLYDKKFASSISCQKIQFLSKEKFNGVYFFIFSRVESRISRAPLTGSAGKVFRHQVTSRALEKTELCKINFHSSRAHFSPHCLIEDYEDILNINVLKNVLPLIALTHDASTLNFLFHV